MPLTDADRREIVEFGRSLQLRGSGNDEQEEVFAGILEVTVDQVAGSREYLLPI